MVISLAVLAMCAVAGLVVWLAIPYFVPSDPKTYDLGFAKDGGGTLYVYVPLCRGVTITSVELDSYPSGALAWAAAGPTGPARHGLVTVGDTGTFTRTTHALTRMPENFTITVITNGSDLGGGASLSKTVTVQSRPSLSASQVFSLENGQSTTVQALNHKRDAGGFCTKSA